MTRDTLAFFANSAVSLTQVNQNCDKLVAVGRGSCRQMAGTQLKRKLHESASLARLKYRQLN